MTIEQCKENIKKIYEVGSKYENTLVAIEELSELQKAITKIERFNYENNSYFERSNLVKNIIEECADVYIIIEKLKLKYDITDENLQEEIEYKIARTLERLQID